MQQHWTHNFTFLCKKQVFINVDVIMKEWFMACWCLLLSVIAYFTQDFPTCTFLSGSFYKQWSSSSSSEEDRGTNIYDPRVILRIKGIDWGLYDKSELFISFLPWEWLKSCLVWPVDWLHRPNRVGCKEPFLTDIWKNLLHIYYWDVCFCLILKTDSVFKL